MRAQTIVFDLWYTLVCPEDIRGRGPSSGAQIPELLGFDTEHFDKYWRALQPRILSSPQPLQQHLETYAAGIGRRLTPEERHRFDQIWSAHDKALCIPRPSIVAALADLRTRGFRLGLLSNAHEREMRHWPESPLAAFFDEACFSFAIGSVKPAAAAYVAVLERLGAVPAATVFVGDGASLELVGAKDAGIAHCIHMRGFLKELGVELAVLQRLSDQADAAVDAIGDLGKLLSLG